MIIKRHGGAMNITKQLSLPPFFTDRRIKCKPEVGDEYHPRHYGIHATAAVRKLCADCILKDPCLEYALDTNQPHGIWGGLDPNQRRIRLITWRRAA